MRPWTIPILGAVALSLALPSNADARLRFGPAAVLGVLAVGAMFGGFRHSSRHHRHSAMHRSAGRRSARIARIERWRAAVGAPRPAARAPAEPTAALPPERTAPAPAERTAPVSPEHYRPPAAANGIVGSLHKLEQPANSTVSTFFPPPSPTIRIIGSPTVQPSRGSRLECTPVEQGIVGFIIGPTDLCDR